MQPWMRIDAREVEYDFQNPEIQEWISALRFLKILIIS